MTRTQRIKIWIKKHQEELIVGGVITGSVVGFTALMIALVKADAEAQRRATAILNARVDELNIWQEAERRRELESELYATK